MPLSIPILKIIGNFYKFRFRVEKKDEPVVEVNSADIYGEVFEVQSNNKTVEEGSIY